MEPGLIFLWVLRVLLPIGCVLTTYDWLNRDDSGGKALGYLLASVVVWFA